MAERKHLYRTLHVPVETLYVRTLDTSEWTKWPHYSGLERKDLRNVMKFSFKPGMVSVIQQIEGAAIVDGRFQKPLHLWKSTFRFPELYDVGVKEYGIGDSSSLGTIQTRVELLAFSKAPPIGQLLVARAGGKKEMVYIDCVETSRPVPSSWATAVAKFSNRWTEGHQEVRLTFKRVIQVDPSKISPEPLKRITGVKNWVWNAFLAFLCGMEWRPSKREALDFAGQIYLMDVVNSNIDNPFANFEEVHREWILIKP